VVRREKEFFVLMEMNNGDVTRTSGLENIEEEGGVEPTERVQKKVNAIESANRASVVVVGVEDEREERN
jgi:hypothetical protein